MWQLPEQVLKHKLGMTWLLIHRKEEKSGKFMNNDVIVS